MPQNPEPSIPPYAPHQIVGLEVATILVAQRYDPASVPSILLWFKKIRALNEVRWEAHLREQETLPDTLLQKLQGLVGREVIVKTETTPDGQTKVIDAKLKPNEKTNQDTNP